MGGELIPSNEYFLLEPESKDSDASMKQSIWREGFQRNC